MRNHLDTAWQRRGISWIWDAEALNSVCKPNEVWSLRQFLLHTQAWPKDLPSNGNDTLVVAGLEGSLDLLAPHEAENWLGSTIKEAILSFQSHYEGEAALVFWLPTGQGRMPINPATDAVSWICAAPFGNEKLEFGRVLWGEAREYPQLILLREGAKPSGLYHSRIT